MKHFTQAFALVCILATAARAGDIPSVGVASPTPAPTYMNSLGEIPMIAGQSPTVGSSDQISVAALNLIQTLLGLL